MDPLGPLRCPPQVKLGREKGRGQWAVNYTSPKSFIITFSYWLAWQLWVLSWILIGWFINLNVQTFQPLNVNYRRGNFCIFIVDVSIFDYNRARRIILFLLVFINIEVILEDKVCMSLQKRTIIFFFISKKASAFIKNIWV